MLPGGPVCPVDPRNEQGVTRRHRPHGLDDGRSDSGLLRRFVIARNPECVACTTASCTGNCRLLTACVERLALWACYDPTNT
jgi:hypothetical protein